MALKKTETMVSYAAFLRGIGPGDPRKSNESLRKVFESCGFANVRSFISSGNILFESKEKDAAKLERKVEKMFKDTHGIEVATFIRTKKQLEAFVGEEPFGKRVHSPETYLFITFLRGKEEITKALPLLKDKKLGILSLNTKLNAVCTVINNSGETTPNFMAVLEKHFSKDITSRTFNTVQRLTKRL